MNKKTNIYDLTICVYVFCTVITDDGSLLMKLARLFLVGVWGLKILVEKRTKVSPYILRMAVFWAFATLSITWAESTEWAMGMSKTLLINLVCMCALSNLIDHKQERLDLALKTMVFAPLFLELRVVQMGGLLAFLDDRGIGSISANMIGLCAASGAIIAMYYWMCGIKKYGLLFIVNAIILILSASKQALLFLGIPLMILFVFDRKIYLKKQVFRCVILLAAGLGSWYLMMHIPLLYELIGRRVEGLFAALTGNAAKVDGSSQSRLLLITWGLDWFQERPLLGYGIDCYRVVLTKNYPLWPIEYYAHNNYVELLVDTGIVGTVLYYRSYADIAARGWRNRKSFSNQELLIFGMFIALIICEVAKVSYFDKYVQVLILIIWVYMSEFDQIKRMQKK